MKEKVLKVLAILLILSIIVGIVCILLNNNKNVNIQQDDVQSANKEQEQTEYAYESITEYDEKTAELREMINISECSDEFMDNYYDGMKELQEIDKKENILIAISKKEITNNYGAIKVVNAPNNQYFLQYNTKEESNIALENLKNDSNIVSVEKNGTYSITDIQSNKEKQQYGLESVKDTYDSWGIESTRLDEACKKIEEEGARNNVVAAIIDTGCDVQLFNKYYNGKIASTYNELKDSENVEDMVDTYGHGTHIAGTIAEGTPSNVKILPIKVSEGNSITWADTITAINYVVDNECADVINMSFGGSSKSTAEEQAIIAASKKNIICVAAAGNDNTSSAHYPSGFDSTISIASCDNKLNKSSFSNYGNTITFTAPGTNIKSIMGKDMTIAKNNGNNSDDDHEIISGTSMATPHAVCAVSILKNYNKNYDLNKIIDILKKYTVDIGSEGWDQYFGYGAINCEMNYCECDCEKCEYIYCENCECEDCAFNKVKEIKDIELINKINYGSKSDIDVKNLQLILKYTDGSKKTVSAESVKENFEILESSINDNKITGRFEYLEKEYPFEIEIGDTSNTWSYEKMQNGTARITEFKQGNVETLYVPEKLNGYTITEIGENVFRYKNNVSGKAVYNYAVKNIKKYILPDTVTYIGKSAFVFSYIEEIQANEISIGNSGFSNCEKLTKVNCNKITNIGGWAFASCKKLESINVTEGLLEIGENAFRGCENLKIFLLPKSLTTIGTNAFYNCNPLLYVYNNSYGHTYAINNNKRYKLLDAHSYIKVNVGTTKFKAFETVNVKNISIELADSEEKYNEGDKKVISSGISVTYQNGNNSFRYGDEYFTVKTSSGEYVEENVYVTVEKATPTYSVPNNITATYGQKLSEIKLPGNFDWMDSTQTISNVGKIKYKAKYTPGDTDNYKIIENIDIEVDVKKATPKYDIPTNVTARYGQKLSEVELPEHFEWMDDDTQIISKIGDIKYKVKYVPEDTIHYEIIENIEITVKVSKAIPKYEVPTNLTAYLNQKLSEIELPEHFEWMDSTQTLSEIGKLKYKAKYIPTDTVNYEIVENIDIEITVKEGYLNGIKYQTHIQDIGWQGWKTDGEMSGTSGQAKRLEGIKISVDTNFEGSIQYRTHIQDIGWQEWKTDGEMSGTSGQAKRLEGIEIKLTGRLAEKYDLIYRTHIQDIGWQGWKTDGEMSGTSGQAKRLEGIEIKIVEKQIKSMMCIDKPSPNKTYYTNTEPEIKVSGWKMSNVSDTHIMAYIDGIEVEKSDIQYYKRDDVLEAIKGYGTKEQNKYPGYTFSVETTNLEDGIHKLKIDLYNNNQKIKTEERNFTIDKKMHLSYQTHIQDIGWQNWRMDGKMSGTTGQAKRLEGINIKIDNSSEITGGIEYRTHIQDIGWQGWKSNGEMSGTTGQAKRLEAIEIKLTGNIAENYDVYYRVHSENFGWLGWAKNGERSGTAGYAYRLEAIEIQLIEHGKTTPSQTQQAFYQK